MALEIERVGSPALGIGIFGLRECEVISARQLSSSFCRQGSGQLQSLEITLEKKADRKCGHSFPDC
jgi:hypothetical protein